VAELVKIRDLSVRFYTYEGGVQALDGVNLSIFEGETLGLVGETGSGKTVTGLAILRLIMPPGKIERGSILFDIDGDEPVDLLKLSESEMREIRGSQIAMIFQEPGSALNPVFSIGNQLIEGIMLHRQQEVVNFAIETLDRLLKNEADSSISRLYRPVRLLKRSLYENIKKDPLSLLPRLIGRIPIIRGLLRGLHEEAGKIAVSTLREVEIPDADRIMQQFPHELSGGMKQRVVIAMALSCCSKLIIADEPTTSLDVTIQVQIIELLKKLKKEFNSSLLYITHNLGVAAELCDRVAVMYAGNICEVASVLDIFKSPLHPYTQALMAAVPKPGEEPRAIGGSVPDALSLPTGCRFHPRCQQVMDICRQEYPQLIEIAPGHFIACHLFLGEHSGSSH
jgi:peptide/nickel transport system ATP-binding protein